jgi:hypothetical protein
LLLLPERSAVEFVKIGEGWRVIPSKDLLEEDAPKPRKDRPGKDKN